MSNISHVDKPHPSLALGLFGIGSVLPIEGLKGVLPKRLRRSWVLREAALADDFW